MLTAPSHDLRDFQNASPDFMYENCHVYTVTTWRPCENSTLGPMFDKCNVFTEMDR